MKFFSRELSEKLQAAGCFSESGFVWCLIDWIDGKEWRPIQSLYLPNQYRVEPKPNNPYDYEYNIFKYKEVNERVDTRSLIQAFGWWDLCGPNERAMENAKIVWPHIGCVFCKSSDKNLHCNKPDSVFHRYTIIDLPEDEVEAYVLKSMEEKV